MIPALEALERLREGNRRFDRGIPALMPSSRPIAALLWVKDPKPAETLTRPPQMFENAVEVPAERRFWHLYGQIG